MEDAFAYIIGHRNPDADAICSAIGYAALKKAQGLQGFVPARCGNSNARIDAILNRFGCPLPEFIGDVTPRVRDIMNTNVIKVAPDSMCAEALEKIDVHDIRMLPVVDSANRLQGTVSVFDLGEHFIPRPREERRMRQVYTTLHNIVRALGAKVIHQVNADKPEELFVRIAAMDIRSFGRFSHQDTQLTQSSIIIVGDRYDIQQRSIQAGVRMLVVTGDLPIEEDVIQMARERDVTIISSPHDSATTSWIIRSAGQVDQLINPKTVNFSPDEKLHVVRRRLSVKDAAACMVVNAQNELLGVFTKTDLLKPVRTNLILVDHNEITQAVPGADQVNILEIVDHHRLGNPPTQQPILFINNPVGSTSTIVGDLFRKSGLTPDPMIAGVLMGGIVSDTLNLRGPTTTQTDHEILDWLSSISEVSPDLLADEIFAAGSLVKSLKPVEVIRCDLKVYEEAAGRFSVSQVEELGFDNLWEHREALYEALEEVRQEESLLFSALMVTNINTQNSLLLVRGDITVINAITYPHQAAHDVFELNGIVSRKKQLIPYLTTLLRGLPSLAET